MGKSLFCNFHEKELASRVSMISTFRIGSLNNFMGLWDIEKSASVTLSVMSDSLQPHEL